jgi:pyridoxine kinase
MQRQKRVATIQDISGFGKCSLTVALPILSAAGISTCIMPTAVLSSPTGSFAHTYRDLTSDLPLYVQKWKDVGLTFDAIYSGFLGSFEQLETVGDFITAFRKKDTLVLVDPVMADCGKLYSTFKPDFAVGMRKLCEKADIIVPNVTEAAFLLGESYRDGPYEKSYIEHLLKELSKLGPKSIVLTGIYFDNEKLGAACYDTEKCTVQYALSKKIEGFYSGTGDVFASVLLASMLNQKTLFESCEIAAEFVKNGISSVKECGGDRRFGINFESELPWLIKKLGLM